jgi:hypothetical protein
MRRCLLRQRNTLVEREHRFFARAGGNGQQHLVKHAGGTRDDIDMPVGNGVESARIDRFCAHNYTFSE